MKTIAFLALLFCMISLSAQNTFQQTLLAGDLRVGSASAVETPDGGFLMLGAVYPSSYDSNAAVVIKFNAQLEIQWVKRFKHYLNDDFAVITALQDGNYLIGGANRQQFAIEEGGNLVKIDGSGNLLWAKLYDDSHDDRTIEIFENSDQTLTAFIRKGVTNTPSKFMKTNSAGSILSSFQISHDDDGLIIDAATSDGAGNFYVTGTFRDNAGNYQIYVIRISDTSISWAKQYGFGRTSQRAYDIAVLNDGSIALTGSVISGDNPSNGNILMIRINSSGAILSSAEFDVGPSDLGLGISPAADGDILLTGFDGNIPNQGLAFKLTTAAGIRWAWAYGTDDGFRIGENLPLSDGRFLLFASMNLTHAHHIFAGPDGLTPCDAYDASISPVAHVPESSDLAVTTASTALNAVTITPAVTDFSLMKEIYCNTETVISSAGDVPSETGNLYPNPANSIVYIERPANAPEQYTILNTAGQVSGIGRIPPGSLIAIPTDHLNPGIYFLPELGRTFVVQ